VGFAKNILMGNDETRRDKVVIRRKAKSPALAIADLDKGGSRGKKCQVSPRRASGILQDKDRICEAYGKSNRDISPFLDPGPCNQSAITFPTSPTEVFT
jgi:hypothetical protein